MSFFLIKSFLKTAKKQFFTPKFFFSQTDTVYNNPAEKSDPTILSLMEYKEAIQSFHSENYIKSEELFKRILTILENSSQNKSDSYIHVLKK